MTKADKAKSTKAKPKRERLIRKGRAAAITKRAASAQATAATVDNLRQEFAEVHDRGMVALENHDFEAVKDALLHEKKIIHTQKTLVERSIRKKLRTRR